VKWTLIILTFLFILFGGCWHIILFDLAVGFKRSSKEKLIDNYKKKENEIFELKAFFNSVVPQGYNVHIEFKNENRIDLFVGVIENAPLKNYMLFEQWNINPYDYNVKPKRDTSEYSPRTNSLDLVKQKLNWTDDTFKEIKKKIDQANCISIDNREPAEVGFARSGMGEYSYVIFNNSIADSLRTEYNDSCNYILYNNKVALEYGGGAFGPDCFPDR
jgi:hypothetical protein